jgi:predicted SnoaL-like aldol condensation-catalyzing enzyme
MSRYFLVFTITVTAAGAVGSLIVLIISIYYEDRNTANPHKRWYFVQYFHMFIKNEPERDIRVRPKRFLRNPTRHQIAESE